MYYHILLFGVALATPVECSPLDRPPTTFFGGSSQNWVKQESIDVFNETTTRVIKFDNTRRNNILPNLSSGQPETTLHESVGNLYITDAIIADQPFRLQVDTGSSTTWITTKDTLCRDLNSNKECYHQNILDIPDGQDPIGDYALSYLDGSAMLGDLYSLPLSLGTLDLPDQVVGVARKLVTAQGDLDTWDGVLGLGTHPPGANKDHIPLMISLLQTEHLKQREMVALAFPNPVDDHPETRAGYIGFGGIPEQVNITSPWATLRMNRNYETTIHGFEFFETVEKKLESGLLPEEVKVLVDTGTSLTTLRRRIAEAIWEGYPGEKREECSDFWNEDERCPFPGQKRDLYKVPCWAASMMEIWIHVTPELKFKLLPGQVVYHLSDKVCVSGIAATDGRQILGQTFLQNNVVMVLDFRGAEENLSVEFASFELKG